MTEIEAIPNKRPRAARTKAAELLSTTSIPNERPRAKQVAAARAKAAETLPGVVRLYDKHEVCAITGATYPTIWAWIRRGEFPPARIVGGKSKWRSTDIEAWMDALPIRKLKGDEEAA